ncbi:MAG: hypothetical protein H6845_00545 [Alphaproteobacteria bacterium]|nr:MAG: hypothetical protein H6845_00545 [Alphaproteobacteria bacterium]
MINRITRKIVFLLSLALFGCDFMSRNNFKTVSLVTHHTMNNNSVLRVDIVQVFEADLWKMLSKMSNQDYFSQKEDIIKQNNLNIKLWSFEPIPQTKTSSFQLQNWKNISYGAVMFISYSSKQKNIIIPNSATHISIALGDKKIENISTRTKPKCTIRREEEKI